MSFNPSHITIEIPMEHGGTLSLRTEYKHFLKTGVTELKKLKGAPPMPESEMMAVMDTVISACAKGAATTELEGDKKKEDVW